MPISNAIAITTVLVIAIIIVTVTVIVVINNTTLNSIYLSFNLPAAHSNLLLNNPLVKCISLYT